MDLKFYLADNTTAATSRVFLTAAGTQDTSETWHLWANLGTPSGLAQNVRLRVEAEDPLNPGSWLTSGLEVLDDAWVRVRIVGSSNPSNNATFAKAGTAWTALGGGRREKLGSMPGNCALYVEFTIRPPLRPGAATETFNIRLVPSHSETMFPVPNGIAETGVGILTHVGDGSTTALLERIAVTATGTPDAYVQVPARRYLWLGDRYNAPADAPELNQTDGDSAALGSGEEYIALLYQERATATVSVLKGSKAAAGAGLAPTLDYGEGILLARVAVAYGAGGSVITTAAITQLSLGGRLQPIDDGGLNVTISPGAALLGAAMFEADYESVVPLTASVTNYVWLSGNGFTADTSGTRPYAGAVRICTAVCDGSAITSLTDTREGNYFEPRAEVVRLAFLDTEPRQLFYERVYRERVAIAAAAYTDMTIQIPANAQVEGVATEVITQPTGTTTYDVGVAGATTRYATGVSTVASTTDDGLDDGVRFYAAATSIRITPDTTPGAADGVIEVEIKTRQVLTLGNPLPGAMAQIPYPWQIDRLLPSLIFASIGATGSTELDVKKVSGGTQTSLFTGGDYPTIAAQAYTGSQGLAEVCTGAAGDWLRLHIVATTIGATSSTPRYLSVGLVVYPL